MATGFLDPFPIEKYERVFPALGEGTFGEVFKYKRIKDDVVGGSSLPSEVAVKMIGKEGTKKVNEKHLERELKAHETCDNLNIVKAYGKCNIKGNPALVLEVCESNLKQHLKDNGGRLRGEDLRNVAYQLCAGLEYLWENDIVHRDLKPANILIRSKARMEIALADFGLARTDVEKTFIESMGSAVGTPAYMAPEIRQGKLGRGHPIDCYCLGLILYQSATGSPIPMHVIFQEDGPLRLVSENISDELLKNFLTKCLQFDPNDRIKKEDLLSHPYFKANEVEITTDHSLEPIPGSKNLFSLVHNRTKKRQLAYVITDVATYDDIMTEASSEIFSRDLKHNIAEYIGSSRGPRGEMMAVFEDPAGKITLREMIEKRGKLTEDEAMKIAEQLVEAVLRAEEVPGNICDTITPELIMVDESSLELRAVMLKSEKIDFFKTQNPYGILPPDLPTAIASIKLECVLGKAPIMSAEGPVTLSTDLSTSFSSAGSLLRDRSRSLHKRLDHRSLFKKDLLLDRKAAEGLKMHPSDVISLHFDPEGTIYCGHRDGNITAIDVAGKEWRSTTSSLHEYGIKSVCSNTKFVYVGSEDGILIALRKVRGGRLEAVNDGIKIGSKDAVVWANEDMVIAAQYNSEVLLFYTADDELRPSGRLEVGGKVFFKSLCFLKSTGRNCVVGAGKRLLWLNDKGEEDGSAKLEDDEFYSVSAVKTGAGDAVWTGTWKGIIYCFNRSGNVVTKIDLGTRIKQVEEVAEGTLAVIDGKDFLLKVTPANGQGKEEVELTKSFYSFVESRYVLYAVKARTGAKLRLKRL